MNLEVNGHNVFIILLVTFLTSLILTPIVKKIAIHINAIDVPNERKVHTKPIPRLGGLAIFLAFMLGYMLYARESTMMLSVLMGSFLIILCGIIDDIKSVKAKYKFIVQIVAAATVCIYGNLILDEITIFGLNLYFTAPWSYIITILFIVAVMNIMNLIDGVDGLASGISSIYFLTIAIIAFILNQKGGLDIILSLIMAGSTLGFLAHNFPPASIFLGDTGSYFLGYIISVIGLLGYKAATLTSIIIPLAILAIPIFDTASAIIRRLLKHQNPFTNPDKEHLHHQFLKMKFSPRTTILIIYFITILFSVISILFAVHEKKQAMIIYVILTIFLLIIVMKTDILFKHKKDKKNKE
ncbi:MAG: undecaprenyl/decaprenyl-phosphate alpha-N-acetylglucosaminyl 1-phosphate transferase [Bacilli bacterium]|nr:undecaprenyl/decaprenyl-phosphate alpha-N-acetylglucosaminyl 1-phosphate transferase [Bacilli bacterium]